MDVLRVLLHNTYSKLVYTFLRQVVGIVLHKPFANKANWINGAVLLSGTFQRRVSYGIHLDFGSRFYLQLVFGLHYGWLWWPQLISVDDHPYLHLIDSLLRVLLHKSLIESRGKRKYTTSKQICHCLFLKFLYSYYVTFKAVKSVNLYGCSSTKCKRTFRGSLNLGLMGYAVLEMLIKMIYKKTKLNVNNVKYPKV